MPSTGKGKAARAAAAAEHPPVDDDSLEDIFLRLDAADIARASIACTAFRGVITEPTFRLRFAHLNHPPPVVGFLEFEEGPAAIDPRTLCPKVGRTFYHASTPAAIAVAKAADFAFSFLPPVPDPNSWRIRDASGGRILLSPAAMGFVDLIVCDPLHHTYFRIPPVPAHLIADTHRELFNLFPFLVPLPDPHPLPATGEKQKEKEPPLQVVWVMQRATTLTAFVFSSSTGDWRRTPTFWPGRRAYRMSLSSSRLYAHGCFYWTPYSFPFHKYPALKLDMREMKFSNMQVPSATQSVHVKDFVIVEASGGDLGTLVLGHHSLDLYCKTTTSREEGNATAGAAADDWRHSRTVPLPHDNLDYTIVGAADGYLLLRACPEKLPRQQARYFSVKLKTLVIEELPMSFNKSLRFVHLYTNFPPLLSLPSVCNEEKAGQDEGVTREASTT